MAVAVCGLLCSDFEIGLRLDGTESDEVRVKIRYSIGKLRLLWCHELLEALHRVHGSYRLANDHFVSKRYLP